MDIGRRANFFFSHFKYKLEFIVKLTTLQDYPSLSPKKILLIKDNLSTSLCFLPFHQCLEYAIPCREI